MAPEERPQTLGAIGFDGDHDFTRTIPTDGTWCRICGLSSARWEGEACPGVLDVEQFEATLVRRVEQEREQHRVELAHLRDITRICTDEAVASARAEVEQAERERHAPLVRAAMRHREVRMRSASMCSFCNHTWPCPEVDALSLLEELPALRSVGEHDQIQPEPRTPDPLWALEETQKRARLNGLRRLATEENEQ